MAGNSQQSVRVPPQLVLQILKQKHQQTHWDFGAMVSSLWAQTPSAGMTKIVKSVTEKCLICL